MLSSALIGYQIIFKPVKLLDPLKFSQTIFFPPSPLLQNFLPSVELAINHNSVGSQLLSLYRIHRMSLAHSSLVFGYVKNKAS